MTSANVAAILSAASTQTAGMQSTSSTQSTDVSFSFGTIMNAASNQTASDADFLKKDPTSTTDVSTAQKDNSVKIDSQTETKEYAADKIEQADTTPEVEKETVSEKLEQFTESVKEELETQFGVSEEDIVQAMTELGLNFLDLLNPQNLTTLSMQLTNSTDVTQLLTNENFLSVMQNMQEISSTLLDGLAVDVQQFGEIISQMELTSQVEVVTENVVMPEVETDVMPETTVTDETTEILPEAKLEANETQSTATTTNVQTAAAEVQPQQETKVVTDNENSQTTENAQSAVEVIHTEENTASENKNQGQTNDQTSNMSEENNTEDLMDLNQLADEQPTTENSQNVTTHMTFERVMTATGTETTQVLTSVVDTQDIINQIAEYTRVQVSPTVSSIEMQLNPENLGKIYLEVSENEGQIRAHITAQNESVKEALISQMATLKDTLNQQGIKVEAVEVSAGTHEFEKNLEEHQQRENENQEQQQQNRGRRNINLNELDELSGLMSEEEALVAQMMMDNGNSVDLTA